MIRRLLTAALDAGTLSRTVLVLSRQLDNAHLLAASEEARADRAELRVAELEAQLEDWREASGELAAEQPAADPLPDLTDAGEAPIPIEPPPDAYHERDRADRLQAMLQACEVELATARRQVDAQHARAGSVKRERDRFAHELAEARAQLQQTERAAGAHVATIERLRNELALAREHAADQHDWSTAAMGRETNHKRTIADLRKRLDDALRAVHKPAPVEQIPGVAAATPYAIWSAEYDAAEAARVLAPLAGKLTPDVCDACRRSTFDGQRTGEAEAVLLCGRCRATAEREETARAAVTSLGFTRAADDEPAPETQPSARTTVPREEPRP